MWGCNFCCCLFCAFLHWFFIIKFWFLLVSKLNSLLVTCFLNLRFCLWRFVVSLIVICPNYVFVNDFLWWWKLEKFWLYSVGCFSTASVSSISASGKSCWSFLSCISLLCNMKVGPPVANGGCFYCFPIIIFTASMTCWVIDNLVYCDPEIFFPLCSDIKQ